LRRAAAWANFDRNPAQGIYGGEGILVCHVISSEKGDTAAKRRFPKKIVNRCALCRLMQSCFDHHFSPCQHSFRQPDNEVFSKGKA